MIKRRFVFAGTATISLLLIVVAVSAEEWQYEKSNNSIQQATVSASGRGPSDTVAARFYLFCSPGKGAGLFLEGEVLNADSIKGFNFADFEGPDAPFGQDRLATLTLRSAERSVTVRSAGAGWYSETNQFKFSIGLDHLPASEKAQVHEMLRSTIQAIELTLHERKHPQTKLAIIAEGQWKSDAVGRVVATCEHP